MKRLFCLALLCTAAPLAFTQSARGSNDTSILPLKRVSLFSSGVGYFEHTGTVTGNTSVKFSFEKNALNDALKSLVVNDEEAGSPQINYLSETTLQRTLQSLKIDLSGEPGLPEILGSLKGAEITVRYRLFDGANAQEAEIRGRIVAVDKGTDSFPVDSFHVLSLATAQGVRAVDLRRLTGFSFTDAAIQRDLGRALDLIGEARTSRPKEISIDLSGRRKREVTVSYVIPTPVWKISYRLDLNQAAPVLQSWAIVDNDGDIDWNGVEVSLVSGKPVSFVQALYPPYYTNRPTLPLAGVGVAEARSYDSGWTGAELAASQYSMNQQEEKIMAYDSVQYDAAGAGVRSNMLSKSPAPAPRAAVAGGASIGAAQSQKAGEQFEFTLKKPVSLARQQSAMLPLFDGHITARKVLVFSGMQALDGTAIHPSIGAELTNTTGIKLPAGSITVFDGGTYAGDALLDFFGANEKRLISYGDDLSVSGSIKIDTQRFIDTVRMSKGLVTLNRKIVWSRAYTIRNASDEQKRLLIEHPISHGAQLVQPAAFDEQTANLYRFEMDLPENEVLVFNVVEETPVSEKIVLTQLNANTLLAYANNAEISEEVRAAFREALRLKNISDNAMKAVTELVEQRKLRIEDQERIRANLTAAGSQTPEGKNYLAQLAALDTQISEASVDIEATRVKANAAQDEYEKYLASLEL